MEYLTYVGGIKSAYVLAGRGPAIVLLHGWMCNRGFWKEQIRFLSKTHQVLAPDLRGHGCSDVPNRGYTLEQLSEDVFNVIEKLSIKRLVIMGHSMGGMVAQQFCVKHMEYVSGLILVTTVAADVQDRLISKRIAKESDMLGFREAFLRHWAGWFAPTTEASLIGWIQEKMLQTPENVALSLVRSYQRFDLREWLTGFSMPTLVIGACSDASAVPAESETLADLIPGAQLVLIEGAGHFPMLETPEVFNKVVHQFLSAHAL